jgi:hypothetical protein
MQGREPEAIGNKNLLTNKEFYLSRFMLSDAQRKIL